MPPPSQPRSRRLTRASRREQLLDVTKGIVGADGLHAVSIDRVAREAGISRPIVYEHFTDLEGLLAALLDREGARANDQLAALLPSPEEAETDGGPDRPLGAVLIATLAAYLTAVRDDPVTWRLMLMPPEGAPVFLRARVDEARDAAVSRLTVMLGRGVADVPDPLLAASSIQALSVHWSRLVLSDPEAFDADRILDGARWAIAHFTGD